MAMALEMRREMQMVVMVEKCIVLVDFFWVRKGEGVLWFLGWSRRVWELALGLGNE